MTGPAPGKIRIPGHGYACNRTCVDLADATIYIHVRGYADAQVTHIDIEGDVAGKIWEILAGGSGSDKVGVLLASHNSNLYVFSDETDAGMVIHIRALGDARATCNGIVGRKEGGIYIGLCSELIQAVESYVEERYGVKPR